MDPTTSTADPFYYVDGFHGGIDGHFPLGTLRDILAGLEAHPLWKVSLEIEPYTWAIVERNDPVSIARLRRLLADRSPAARVELVSAAYAEPYLWNVTGESVVRQLRYGRAAVAAVLPEAVVDTYAVQEPCWTSCLPQLLRSFGYRRAALPNSTCWGGYHAGRVDADLCHWVGPDGSAITTAPRYGVDGLVGPATEENATLPVAYADKCHAARIAHPAGTILQDAGWPARPWAPGHEQGRPTPPRPLQHVTWREYVDTIAEPAEQRWVATQEDLRVGLVWGATVVQRIAQVCRAGENEVAQTEKLAAMAAARRGRAYPADALRELWTDVLLSQHHDVWIVPYNRNNVGTWASECDARYANGHKRCLAMNRDAMAALSPSGGAGDAATQAVRVFNTAGFARREVAAVDVVADVGTTGFTVHDGDGKAVPCQAVLRRKFPDASMAAATVLLPADVPATGYATYTVSSVAGKPSAELLAPTTRAAGASVTTGPDGVAIETDLYRLAIDPARGGAITSLVAKNIGGREFVDRSSPRAFNEYRGFFPDAAGTGGEWLTSTAAAATVETIEAGPVRVTLRLKGRVGPHPFVTTVSLAQGQRRIDVSAAFDFPVDGLPFEKASRPQRVRIGEPWPTARDATRSDRRPFYDGSYKLRALFPAAVGRSPAVSKDAPFDVCRSALTDTRFDSWSTIKHNVLVSWVDVAAADASAGLAVLCDHTTAYDHGALANGGEPLGLVLGYSGLGNWADFALGRPIRVSYALVPHAGDWAAGRVWREAGRWAEPLTSVVMAGPPVADDWRWSLVDATDGGLHVAAVERTPDGATDVRLFNAEGTDGPQAVTVPAGTTRAELVELDGRPAGPVPVAGGRVTMPRFGVRTLRLWT